MLPSLNMEVKDKLQISLRRFNAAEGDLSNTKCDDAKVQLPNDQLGIGLNTW